LEEEGVERALAFRTPYEIPLELLLRQLNLGFEAIELYCRSRCTRSDKGDCETDEREGVEEESGRQARKDEEVDAEDRVKEGLRDEEGRWKWEKLYKQERERSDQLERSWPSFESKRWFVDSV
jgi:hypothetical protein